MDEESNDSNKSTNLNIVSVKSEKGDELVENWTSTALTEDQQIRTKLEDDISDADSTPPQANNKDHYDFMKTPEHVPNYSIKDEHLLDSDTINNTEPELDPKNNCDNNVVETMPDDSTGNKTNSACINYEEVPEDILADSVYPRLQVKKEPSLMPEQVPKDKITDQTNRDAIPKMEANNNLDCNVGTMIVPNEADFAEKRIELVPDDFFENITNNPSDQVKHEPSAGVVPKMELVTNDSDTNQTEITDRTHNKDATLNIINNDASNNEEILNLDRRINIKNEVDKTTQNGSTGIDSVPRKEPFDDFLYDAFPVKTETNTQDDNRIPTRSDHVSLPTGIDCLSLESMREHFLKKLDDLTDDELPCTSSSLRKKKKKHRKHSQDSEDSDYKRHKKRKHYSRDDGVDDRQHSRDIPSHKSHRHKRERERRSPSLSEDRLLTKKRRDDLTPNRAEIKMEHDFDSLELEILLKPDEKKYVINQPKIKLINFRNLMPPPCAPPLSETFGEKIQNRLNRAIKQLKAIESKESPANKFIFTQTISTAKSNQSILSQINLNPSPLSSNKEFIFSQTSIGANVNLSDYGLEQPPELSQHLMRIFCRDIKHFKEMRRSTRLPPKISTMMANSSKTETKKYQSMLYRDTETQTDAQFFKKLTRDTSTQYCDIDFLDIKDNTDKQKYAFLLMQETFNTPVYSASEEVQQNLRIFEAVKSANRKYRCNSYQNETNSHNQFNEN